MEKLCAGQLGRVGANMFPMGENLSAVHSNFDTHAAIFGCVINFRAAQTERVFDAGDGCFVA